MFAFDPAVLLSIFNLTTVCCFLKLRVWPNVQPNLSRCCLSPAVVSAVVCLYLQGAGQEKLGIYIKSVVKGGAADVVGCPRERCIWAGSEEDTSDSSCAVCVHTGWPSGCRWPVVERGRTQSGWPVAREVQSSYLRCHCKQFLPMLAALLWSK